jgi:Co/Zn/Cd efflux system component
VRAEVLGALVNSVFLGSLCLSIVIEAIKRFVEKQDIKEVDLLLYVACVGLAINVVGLFIFGHGHSHGVPTDAVEQLGHLESDAGDIELAMTSNNKPSNDAKATSQDTGENDLEKKLVDDGATSDELDKNYGKKSGQDKRLEKKARCCSFLSKHSRYFGIQLSYVNQILLCQRWQ